MDFFSPFSNTKTPISSLTGPLGVLDTQHRDPSLGLPKAQGHASDLLARTFNSSS